MAVSAEAITAVIAAESGLDEARLTPDATLKDLDIGSLDMASVAFELEDRFGFELDPENIDPEFTIAEFVAYVQSLKRAA
ncbi:MAG: acyl carrier protein [Novosphingobium sp.]